MQHSQGPTAEELPLVGPALLLLLPELAQKRMNLKSKVTLEYVGLWRQQCRDWVVSKVNSVD